MKKKSPSPKLKVFASGAASSKQMPDFSKCPTEAIEAVVARFDYGEAVSGYDWSWQRQSDGKLIRGNYKKGVNDPAFIRDRYNHALRHLSVLASEKGSYKDLEAAMCNLAMLAFAARNGTAFDEVFPNASFALKEMA